MEGASLEVCKICNEHMNDPRILHPCAHSFCLKCLECTAVSKDLHKCPTCKMDFEMPRSGLKDLKKNEFVNRLNNLKKINNCSVKCDSCKFNQAIYCCNDNFVSENYCSTCLEYQGRIPTSTSHRIFDHQETTLPIIDTFNVNKYSTCKDHNESESSCCDGCKFNQAFCCCNDNFVSENYWSTYLEYQGRMPTFASHRIFDHQETTLPIIDTFNVNKYSTCKDHNESESLYCDGCKIVLCSRCLTLKHKNHDIMHLSEYFDALQIKYQEHLKMKEETLQNVITNFKSSKDTMSKNELKASNLKKDIIKRGESVKNAVDSIVNDLIKEVDEFLKQHKREADLVMTELNKMETTSNSNIEILKENLNDLCYVNVVERSFMTLEKMERIENIPKYCENFNVSFHNDEQMLSKLKNIFGNVGRDKLVKRQFWKFWK